MAGLLDNIRKLFRPDPSGVRRVELLNKLEARKAFLENRIAEHFDRLDSFLDPMERWRDGDRLYLPAGYLRDRRYGDNWPVLANMQDVQRFRGQSRLLVDTNSYAGGFLDRLVDFVVGDGHTPECHLRGQKTGAVSTGVADADGNGVPDTDPAVDACQQVLDEFRELNEWGCGAQDREAEAYRRSERDGEVMVRFFKGGADSNGIPRVRFVEPEQIDTPPNSSPEERWGFQHDPDDAETLTAAYVKSLHDLTGAGKWVKADAWVWHKLGTDRSVIRGISPFAVVAHAFEQADKINDHLAEVAAIQAAIAYVRQHAEGVMPSQISEFVSGMGDTTQRGGRGRADRYTQVRWDDGAGQVVDMSNGMQFVAGPASTGTPGYIQALQSRLRQICARFGMPEFFTGDASNNNYASILVSGGPFERSVKRRQKVFGEFQKSVYKRVLIYAAAAGRISEEDLESVDVRVVTPGVAIANKLEETQIRQIENQAGVLSVQTWMSETGRDPALEMANKEAWDEKFGGVGQQLGPDGQPQGDGQGDPNADPESDPKNGGDTGTARESFNPSQARDENGKWTKGGGAAGAGKKKAQTRKPSVSTDGTVWHRAKAGTVSAERQAEMREHAKNPGKMTPEQVQQFAADLKRMTVAEIQSLRAAAESKHGRLKAQLAERLLQRVRDRNSRERPAPDPTDWTNGKDIPDADARAAAVAAFPSLKGVGQHLNVKNLKSPVTRRHVAELAKLPAGVHERLAASGALDGGVYVGDVPMVDLDDNSHLRDLSPRGWSDGKTWGNSRVPGAYNDLRRQVTAGDGPHGSASLALHEYGHAIEHSKAFGYPPLTREMAAHHTRLYSKLDPYEQQGGPAGYAGRSEMFAESVAVRYHLGRDEAIRRYDEEYVNWLESAVEKPHG